MQTTEVEFGPAWPSYSTISEAVTAGDTQPEQMQAKHDSLKVAGSILESGQFGNSHCVLNFSNGWHLLVEARDFYVQWIMSQAEILLIQPVVRRCLHHYKSGQEWEFDPKRMLDEIVGLEFVMLRVTARNLLVYTRGNDIFWLSAYREISSGQELLHAVFES